MATSLENLIPVLLDKTTTRKLAWEALSGPSFITRLESAALEITLAKDGNTILILRDEQGRSLEQTSYTELSVPVDEMLVNLYAAVRRNALNVETILQSVKTEIEKL
jgi:hypothetical protein